MMKINPVQAKLDALKSLLRNLKPQQVPEGAQMDLRTASRYLNELAQDLEASQDQLRLAALYRVSQILGTSLDLDEVITQVMDAVIALTGAERGFLVLLESGGGEWRVHAARNFNQESLQSQETIISRTVVQTVLDQGRGVLSNDAQTDPRFSERESVVIHALRSIMCAPLLARGQLIGAIYVDNRAQAGLFSDGDLEMMNALAIQAAIAIENARLYTRTDQALARRVAELETLARLDKELNASLELDRMIRIVHQWTLQQAKADRGWVLRTDSGALDSGMAVYPDECPYLKEPLLYQAEQMGVPKGRTAGEGLRALLLFPLKYGEALIGMVVLERTESFEKSEEDFLEHLVSRAAVAIQNARLYQAVQQASEAKTSFISVVTHELRIPMTSIKGYADLLRQGVVGALNEQQLSFIDIIRNNVERMSVLVTDLSDISKVESGRLKLSCALIPLKVYLDEAVRVLRPKLEAKGQSLEIDLPSDLPQVFADYNRLIQVLSNLISNANKYTPAEGEIRLVARPEGDFVRVEVSDNGIGIPPQDQAKIFTQFFRSEHPSVRNEQGWGLGLSVARRLVEVMDGTMGFYSHEGEGSTFWFTLPTSAQEAAQ
ncbi:MAG: GAF domain-containing protein [Anaerolineales bacterium]|nr:GAF domain-containing protein [Anaerolineales bacterium]